MTDSWKSVKRFGGTPSRVCATFELHFYPHLPDGSHIKIKVMEESSGQFIAMMNVCMKGGDGTPGGQVGIGKTMEQALEDVLVYFDQDVREHIEKNGPLTEDVLHWEDPIQF